MKTVNQAAKDLERLSPEVSSKLSLVSDRGHSGGLLSPSAGGTRTFACPKHWPWLARVGSVPRNDLQLRLGSFSTFWILLWVFFLLGLFLGQCSPDI